MEPFEGMSPGPEYHALTRLCGEMCTALPVDSLFPSLIANGVIDWADKDRICGENLTQQKRVEALLNIIIKDTKINDCQRFQRFQHVLKITPNCHFLLHRLNKCLTDLRQNQLSAMRKSLLLIRIKYCQTSTSSSL